MIFPTEFQLTFGFPHGVSEEYELVSQIYPVVSMSMVQAESEHWFLPQPLHICDSWTQSPSFPSEGLFQFVWSGVGSYIMNCSPRLFLLLSGLGTTDRVYPCPGSCEHFLDFTRYLTEIETQRQPVNLYILSSKY